MVRSGTQILSPVGIQQAGRQHAPTGRAGRGEKGLAIGLLNNSKPNVDFFLDALRKEILAQGNGYEVISVTKPRSAAPCPDIDALAKRCSFVINAVAD
ncbi:MAG: hypothetical protein HYY78_00340 [Betaproteobacteria bacterium]|nr:hypothetical protein [Betaproteobacteria bacterium]